MAGHRRHGPRAGGGSTPALRLGRDELDAGRGLWQRGAHAIITSSPSITGSSAISCGSSNDAGCAVTVVPATATPRRRSWRCKPDGVLLSNGPGDPAATGKYAVPSIQAAPGQGRADLRHLPRPSDAGARGRRARPSRCTQGHHGANHPVKDFTTGKVEIVSMNHGFAVDRASLPANAEETHVSLFDGSNCGIALDRPSGLFGAVSSRGLARAARQPLSLPPVRRYDGRAPGWRRRLRLRRHVSPVEKVTTASRRGSTSRRRRRGRLDCEAENSIPVL